MNDNNNKRVLRSNTAAPSQRANCMSTTKLGNDDDRPD